MTRNEPTGSALIGAGGSTTGIYRRCPHCGMVDLQYSAQGMKQAHHQITRVGALLKYECGKCRKNFLTFEVCVPTGTDPFEFFDRINSLLKEA